MNNENIEQPAESGSGWLEAAIAWSVCASIHEKFAKRQDAFFSTRQADFLKHEKEAKEKHEKILTEKPVLPLKDHQIAALINRLRDIATEFRDAGQLRSRIADEIVPMFKAAQPASEDASEPIMFGKSPVENMQIDVLCMVLKEGTTFDGDALEKAWNELVQFYVKHRNSPTSSQPVLPAVPSDVPNLNLARLGQYVTDFAKRHGWDALGAEGAFEFIQRKSYVQGIEDARCGNHQSMPSDVPEPVGYAPIDGLERLTQDKICATSLFGREYEPPESTPLYTSPIPQDLLVRVLEALEIGFSAARAEAISRHAPSNYAADIESAAMRIIGNVIADIRKLEGK